MKKNPFKEILTNKEVPPEVKKRVMSEIASIGLAVEVADLFTGKFASIFEVFFAKNKARK